jgi:hypothetical protein
MLLLHLSLSKTPTKHLNRKLNPATKASRQSIIIRMVRYPKGYKGQKVQPL